MKLNQFKYMMLAGAALLLAGTGITSCDDANDWEVDESHDRLFRTNSLAVEADLYEAKVTFKRTTQTDYYVIEVSTDTLYDEVPMRGEHALIFGEDKSIRTTPCTISGLQKDTKYYIRMKSKDLNGKESKWAYTEKRYFKTKKEQIVTDYVKTENSMTFTWTPGYTLTHVQVIPYDAEGNMLTDQAREVRLTDEDKTSCSITVTGLTPLTRYMVYLMNNDDIKGYVDFQTNAGIPASNATIAITAENPLTQYLIDQYVADNAVSAENTRTITLTFPAGASWYVHQVNKTIDEVTNEVLSVEVLDEAAGSLQIPSGLSVNFYGMGGGDRPTLYLGGMGESGIGTTGLKVPGKHEAITFYNLIIDGSIVGTENVLSILDSGSGESFNIGHFSFDDCELRNYQRCLVRLQSANCLINTVKVNNCLVHDFGGNNYSFMQAKANEGSIDKIEFTNSTLYNFLSPMKSFMQFENSTTIGTQGIDINQCTFYGIVGEGQYFIDFKDTGGAVVTIANTIVSKTLAAAKGGRNKANGGSFNIQDSYKTTDWDQTKGNAIEGFNDYEGSAKALFQDAANGNFGIKDVLFQGYNKAGDPRWFTAE